jgi:hypothetical protein
VRASTRLVFAVRNRNTSVRLANADDVCEQHCNVTGHDFVEKRSSAALLHGIQHALQLFGSVTEAVTPISMSSVVVNRATPTFGSRFLDSGIAHLALDFNNQAPPAILQLDHEVRQVLPECAFLTVRDDEPESVVLNPRCHCQMRTQQESAATDIKRFAPKAAKASDPAANA